MTFSLWDGVLFAVTGHCMSTWVSKFKFILPLAPKKARRKSITENLRGDVRPGTPLTTKCDNETVTPESVTAEQKKYLKSKHGLSQPANKENITHKLATTPVKSYSQHSIDKPIGDTTVDSTESSHHEDHKLSITPHRLTSNSDSVDGEPHRPLVNSQSSSLATQHNKPNKVQFTSSTENRLYQKTEFDFR